MKKLMPLTTILFALGLPIATMANDAGPSSYYLEQALSQLPKDKAEEFQDTMQQAHEQNKALYDQAHQLHEDMHKILTADTFDKDAFISKSRQLQKIHDKIGANLDVAFATAESSLSTDERKTLADAMEEQHQVEKAAKTNAATTAQ